MADLSVAGISQGAITSSLATLPSPCKRGSSSVGSGVTCRRMICCASSMLTIMLTMNSVPRSEAEFDELAVHHVVEILLQRVEFFQKGGRLRAEYGFPSAGPPFLTDHQGKSKPLLHGIDVGPRLAIGDSHRFRGCVDRTRLLDETKQVLTPLAEYRFSVHFQPDLGAHLKSGIPVIHRRKFLSMNSVIPSESLISSSGTSRFDGSSLLLQRARFVTLEQDDINIRGEFGKKGLNRRRGRVLFHQGQLFGRGELHGIRAGGGQAIAVFARPVDVETVGVVFDGTRSISTVF